jgi:hypothetical protein
VRRRAAALPIGQQGSPCSRARLAPLETVDTGFNTVKQEPEFVQFVEESQGQRTIRKNPPRGVAGGVSTDLQNRSQPSTCKLERIQKACDNAGAKNAPKRLRKVRGVTSRQCLKRFDQPDIAGNTQTWRKRCPGSRRREE